MQNDCQAALSELSVSIDLEDSGMSVEVNFNNYGKSATPMICLVVLDTTGSPSVRFAHINTPKIANYRPPL